MQTIKDIIHSNFNYIDYCYLCSVLHKFQHIQNNYLFDSAFCSLGSREQISSLVNQLNAIKLIYETRYLPVNQAQKPILYINQKDS